MNNLTDMLDIAKRTSAILKSITESQGNEKAAVAVMGKIIQDFQSLHARHMLEAFEVALRCDYSKFSPDQLLLLAKFIERKSEVVTDLANMGFFLICRRLDVDIEKAIGLAKMLHEPSRQARETKRGNSNES
jgi:hypothetical protein